MKNKSMQNNSKKRSKKIRINLPIHGYKPGDVVYVETSASGTPLSREWCNRVRDWPIDHSFTDLDEDGLIKCCKEDDSSKASAKCAKNVDNTVPCSDKIDGKKVDKQDKKEKTKK
jgi:hypothetical protein